MMGSVVAFAGPSVPLSMRSRWQEVCWLPPARAGDILNLRNSGFDAVVLIDGYFDHCPAPWHKEILAILAEGVVVAGASSMGALRAAELDDFGMIGAGVIYRAYRSGLLTGDDEVALVHAPERLGWEPLSVPMVEIRATLVQAMRQIHLDISSARRLRSAAHEIHFVDRDWPSLSKVWSAAGFDDKLIHWLTHHHLRLKQADAEQCLDMIKIWRRDRGEAQPVPNTVFLQRLQAAMSANARSASENIMSPAFPLKG